MPAARYTAANRPMNLDQLRRDVGVRQLAAGHALAPLDPPAKLAPGDLAWVWAFGRLRRGRVVKLGRTRATVEWVSPSNPDTIRSTTALASYVYPDRRAAESGAA